MSFFKTRHFSNRLKTRWVSSDTTLTASMVQNKPQVLVDTSSAAVTLTLPSPASSLRGFGLVIVNYGSYDCTIVCSAGFPNAIDTKVIVPNQGIILRCEHESGLSGTYRWLSFETPDSNKLERSTWTPTNTFTTATPTLATTNYEYWVLGGKFVFFIYNWSTTDGAGATALTASLPLLPPDIDVLIPCRGQVTIAGTATDVWAYIDATQATGENRLLKFHNFQTLTDDAACSIAVMGIYPIRALDWTAGETYATASVTENADADIWDRIGFGFGSWNDADSDAAATFTCALPFGGTPDRDGYMPCLIQEISGAGGATRTNAKGSIDLANAATASRLISCKDYTTPTDGQACRIDLSAFWEIGGWKSWTPGLTWTTGTPASITKSGYYTVQNGLCFGWAYLTSADGNGATALVIDLPKVPAYQANRVIPVWDYQLQNATYYVPCSYIPANQAAAADRQKIVIPNFDTATDAETVTMVVAFVYPVE